MNANKIWESILLCKWFLGLYMPSICLIAGALFIKACGKWCQLQQNPFALSDAETDGKNTVKS